MVIDICLPTLNQAKSTQATLESFKNTQAIEHRYIIVDNGSTPPVRDWLLGLTGDDIVIRNSENVGLPKAMNQARKVSDADFILYTHTDVLMYEQDWDTKITKILEGLGSVGVAGAFGALGLGTGDLYQSPYRMQQLVRTRTLAGNKCRLNPLVHGQMQFHEEFQRCAVLDGFLLIVRNGLTFWDQSVHHMYDNDICFESMDKGWQNIVINLDIDHLGGKTDVNEDWASPFGKSKAEIHAESHLPFYEKWRPGKRGIHLPYSV